VQELVALAQAIASLAPSALLALGFLLVVLGVLRPGRQVDAERARIEAERAVERAEYLRREGLLIAERDDWKRRSIEDSDRLDRVSRAFERLAKAPAPE